MASMVYIQNQHNIAPPIPNVKVHLTLGEAAIVNGWFPDEHPNHGGDPARWARALVALANEAGLATLWPALFVGRPLQVVDGSPMFHILTQVVVVGTTAIRKRRRGPAVVPRAIPPAGVLMRPPAQQQHLLQQQVQQLHQQQQQQHQQHQHQQQQLQQQHQQRQQALRTQPQQSQHNEQQLQAQLQRQEPGLPQGLKELRQEVREANVAHNKKLDELAVCTPLVILPDTLTCPQQVVNSIAPRVQATPHTIIISIVSANLRFAVSRLCTLPWLVSRLAQYFYTVNSGYKLGAFVQFPAPAVRYLTAENIWKEIIEDPRNAEITIFGEKWEQWSSGDGLVARYRTSDDRITIPRTAPLSWVVARVSHWFQRADHGFLIVAELPDFTQHELRNDQDWREIAELRHVGTIWLSTKQ
ncbi:hypothetical protein FN846DRAFT_993177 [Sphaerosporella brunnea]|uniref:Uncharacterized protein n=1 Tax=Sphaerosporella brunnea TaxID=1250544 RepID=A0A5J5EM33_9PEZI|nr:hypothetical protein FN846DRAFT_993177 [Sphaerosporella brunnea]